VGEAAKNVTSATQENKILRIFNIHHHHHHHHPIMKLSHRLAYFALSIHIIQQSLEMV
jgi:hypothetical protein